MATERFDRIELALERLAMQVEASAKAQEQALDRLTMTVGNFIEAQRLTNDHLRLRLEQLSAEVGHTTRNIDRLAEIVEKRAGG